MDNVPSGGGKANDDKSSKRGLEPVSFILAITLLESE